MKKICEICGKKYEWRLETWQDSEERGCLHDDQPTKHFFKIDGLEKYRRRLDEREKMIRRHEKGILPRSYYSINEKTGKPYLSPKKLYKEGI